MTQTLLNALLIIPGLVIAIVFHEVAHGWVALMLGDPTARERRRLTLNPLRHVDPFGTIILPGMLMLAGAPAFGWAKPVPVDKQRLDNPRYGMMAVAAAGPGTNILLAAIGAVMLGMLAAFAGDQPGNVTLLIANALQNFLLINIFLALFNLLPIPPFDGSHILEGLLPRRAALAYERLRPFGIGLLFLLLLVIPWLFPQLGIVENLIWPPVAWLHERFMHLANLVAGG